MRQDSQESDKALLNGSGCNGAPFASWLKKNQKNDTSNNLTDEAG